VKDVIVIGAGIIGATIAKSLQTQGRDVLVIDSNESLAGTKPSGGHLKPSWFGGMSKTEYEPAMELLNETWGLIEEQFTIKALGISTGVTSTVYRVDTDKVIEFPRVVGRVCSLQFLDNYPNVVWNNGESQERCRLLIVAAGVWCGTLLPQLALKIQRKQGISFRYKGQLKEPFINPWAPYKQIVAHQQSSNEIWIGDGSTILQPNWTAKRELECRTRCENNLQKMQYIRSITGLRPYCESGKDPCLLKQVFNRVWVATGAGKSGTIAAGWVARKIIDATS